MANNMEVDDTSGKIGSPSNEILAAERKQEGNKLYSAKLYREALKLYTDAIDLDPKCAAYYGNRSATYLMLKDYQNALNDAMQATSIDPTFVRGYHREAKCHIAMGSANAAKRCLQKAKELDPGNRVIDEEEKTAKLMLEYEAHLKKAQEANDHRKAEFCIRKLLEFAADCPYFKTLQAEVLINLGKFDDAASIANDVLRKDSQNVEAIYVKGMTLYYQDQTEKAYKVFQQLLRMAPDYKKGREAYRKAKQLESKKFDGNAAFKEGNFNKALELYTSALEIDPLNKFTNAKLFNNRAMARCKLGSYPEAIDDCNKAIELDPKYLKAYLRRAKCFMDSRQFEEAVRDYEKIVKMNHSHEYKQLLREAKFELKKSKRKDYYKILGVSQGATDDEIKKAYRKEALKHHPDRHSHADESVQKAEERQFKEVGEAYSVLSDKNKRARYDNGQDLEDNGFSADFDPNQIFQAFFGGHGAFPFSTSNQGFSGGFSGSNFPSGFSFSFG